MARTVMRQPYFLHINTSCVPRTMLLSLMTCRLHRSTRHPEPTAIRAEARIVASGRRRSVRRESTAWEETPPFRRAARHQPAASRRAKTLGDRAQHLRVNLDLAPHVGRVALDLVWVRARVRLGVGGWVKV